MTAAGPPRYDHRVRVCVAIGVVVAAWGSGCNVFDPRADGFECDTTADCEGERTCVQGFCVLSEGNDGGDGSDAAVGPFAAPTRIDAVSFPSRTDDDPTVTADLLEMLWESARMEALADIYQSTRSSADEPWGPAEPGPGLSTAGVNDACPGISADGKTLLITREGEVMITTRPDRDTDWAAPVPVPELNTVEHDSCPELSTDGLSVVLQSERAGGAGGFDMWIATRASVGDSFSEPINLAGVNTGGDDASPQLSNSSLTLAFHADGADHDLFRATRASKSDPFGNIEPIAELNSPDSDDDPWLSADGRYIVFSTTRDGQGGELYEASC